jgi:hypothetical protein
MQKEKKSRKKKRKKKERGDLLMKIILAALDWHQTG